MLAALKFDSSKNNCFEFVNIHIFVLLLFDLLWYNAIKEMNTAARMTTRAMARNLSARACKVPPPKSKQPKETIKINKEALTVIDVPAQNMFIMKIGNEEANVEYELKENVYDLVFSNVPNTMQGQGIGKILAQVRNYCTTAYEGPAAVVSLDLYENAINKQFTMKLNGIFASIDFDLNNGIYTLSNTSVPENYRARGVGKILAQKTFDLIVEKNKKMKLTCEFLDHFYNQNKKNYEKFVVT